MNAILQSWLSEAAVMVLILGAIAGILIGLLLIFAPQRLARISAVLDRWVSTRPLDRALERQVTLDPWIYRHRRWAGGLILAGALFILYFFTVRMERAIAVATLTRRFHLPEALTGSLLDALVLIALLGALCAVFVALCLLFRPSLLRQFEQSANRWFSLRRAMKPLEAPRDDFNDFVARHARQVGVFLLMGGIYILAMLAGWLAHL